MGLVDQQPAEYRACHAGHPHRTRVHPHLGNPPSSLVDHGLRVQTVRIAAEETLPNDLAEVDGVLSLGGPQSITDDPPSWVDTETTFLREAGDAQIPILGIGLGANLLAKAHGATIETAPSTDAGFHRVDLDPAGREDPLFRGLPWFGSWPVWSRDRIAGLPDGGRKLASRDGTAIDGFACGIFSYGIAFEADWSSTTLSERMQDPPIRWPRPSRTSRRSSRPSRTRGPIQRQRDDSRERLVVPHADRAGQRRCRHDTHH